MKAFFKVFLILPFVLLLASCSGRKALNFFVPKTGYQLLQAVAYGPDPRQQMDIYVPEHLRQPGCTVLFLYGGRWTTGDRGLYRFAGQAFASEGCVAAVADYRVYPRFRYPVFLEDTAQAFVYLHNHAAEYGADPAHMFVAGHSAGAYNAVMLAMNPEYLKKAGGNPAWIRGVIGVAGPYDFLPFDAADIIDIFSTERSQELTQPIHYARAGLPPMLLVAGENDTEVKPKNTLNLAAELRQYKDPVEVHIYPDAQHEAIVLSLLNGFRGKIPLLHDSMQFIQEHP
jgi:acetyl esterase/lipase